MGKIKLTREELTQELDLPCEALEDHVIDNSRWSIEHEIIFEYKGKYYRAYYSVGATEMQDERPWEYEDVIECEEVVKVDKLQSIWTPVDDGEYQKYLTVAEHRATIRSLLEELQDLEVDSAIIFYLKANYYGEEED